MVKQLSGPRIKKIRRYQQNFFTKTSTGIRMELREREHKFIKSDISGDVDSPGLRL
jgi:PBP1b-binding outer membrane lipoprotein LpoB